MPTATDDDEEVMWATSGTGDDFQCVHVADWREAKKRIAELEDILDTISMHGVERAQGWMMVPKTEWDQAFARAGLRKKPVTD